MISRLLHNAFRLARFVVWAVAYGVAGTILLWLADAIVTWTGTAERLPTWSGLAVAVGALVLAARRA